MFVKRYGSGARVCFGLHGWSGDHRTFQPLAPLVPEGVCLWAADLPGCGDSEEPAVWRLGAIVDEIGRTVEGIDGGRVTLVGTCIGAVLAARVAAERPELVERLVLMDAFARWPWYFRVFTAPGWGKYAYASTFANPVGRWVTNRALASKRTDDTDLTGGFARARHGSALRYLQVMREVRSVNEFAGIDVPVDVIFGSRSFGVVKESAEAWRGVWPQARVWELAGAGHLLVQEAAERVAEIVFGGSGCQLESADISSCTHL